MSGLTLILFAFFQIMVMVDPPPMIARRLPPLATPPQTWHTPPPTWATHPTLPPHPPPTSTTTVSTRPPPSATSTRTLTRTRTTQATWRTTTASSGRSASTTMSSPWWSLHPLRVQQTALESLPGVKAAAQGDQETHSRREVSSVLVSIFLLFLFSMKQFCLFSSSLFITNTFPLFSSSKIWVTLKGCGLVFLKSKETALSSLLPCISGE